MKQKNLAKMIRQFFSSLSSIFVGLILFLFKNIESFFKLIKNKTTLFRKHFSSFLEDYRGSIKEGLCALFICAFGDLIAGLVLGKMDFFLENYAGLLVLIPGAIGMRGNIFGSFGSRLSTNLHIGILTPEFKRSENLDNNILSSIVLTLILSLFLAVLAKGICILFKFPSMSIVDFILISVIAGIISNVIMLPITMFISLKSFENDWDPDNITTPVIAAFGDLFTLPAIILSIFVLTALNISIILKYTVFLIFLVLIAISFIFGIKSSGEETRKIIKQSTPILFICSILGILAGSILNSSLTTLLTNTALLTLLPLFSGESGSLVSILGARLSSGLHSGLIEPVLKPKKNIFYNFFLCIILTAIIYPLIGIFADIASVLTGGTGIGLDKIVLISSSSGFILIPIMMIIVFYVSILSYRNDLDPDNVVIPISTSITDSISSFILIVISLIVTGALVI